jgi:hypothetical protein
MCTCTIASCLLQPSILKLGLVRLQSAFSVSRSPASIQQLSGLDSTFEHAMHLDTLGYMYTTRCMWQDILRMCISAAVPDISEPHLVL